MASSLGSGLVVVTLAFAFTNCSEFEALQMNLASQDAVRDAIARVNYISNIQGKPTIDFQKYDEDTRPLGRRVEIKRDEGFQYGNSVAISTLTWNENSQRLSYFYSIQSSKNGNFEGTTPYQGCTFVRVR